MGRPKGTSVWPPIPTDQLWTWYWEDLLTPGEIARLWGSQVQPIRPGTNRGYPTDKWVTEQLVLNKIPQRSASERASLWQKSKLRATDLYTSDRAHRKVYSDYYNVQLDETDEIHHKDHLKQNNHPLNLELKTKADHTREHVKLRKSHNSESRPARIPMFEVYMRMTDELATRSHHETTKIGCVITSFDLRRVLSVGFNGNAAGLADSVDSSEPGQSQTIHAEENALVMAGEHGTDRVMFVSESPCLMCTKLIINCGVKYLYYRREYRDSHPLKIARYMGIMTCRYDKWLNEVW